MYLILWMTPVGGMLCFTHSALVLYGVQKHVAEIVNVGARVMGPRQMLDFTNSQYSCGISNNGIGMRERCFLKYSLDELRVVCSQKTAVSCLGHVQQLLTTWAESIECHQ